MSMNTTAMVNWPTEPKTRTREEWVAWGLPKLDPRHYGEWVYTDLPAMGEFCEAEVERVLKEVLASRRAIQHQLDIPDLPQEQRQRLSNIQSRTLAPQQAILEIALEELRDKRGAFSQGDLCRAVDALLAVFDANTPLVDALEGVEHLSQLFRSQRYFPGIGRLDRLRISLSIAAEAQADQSPC